MNFFETSKITTLAITLVIASSVYMSNYNSSDNSTATVDYSKIIDVDNDQSNLPTPATMLFFGTGLAGFATLVRKKN